MCPALVGASDIDAVYISTTNELHRDQVFAAAARRQARAVRKAAGARRSPTRARWSPNAARAAWSWASTTTSATPRHIARCARRSSRAGSASRCSRAYSTPSICRRHLQGWRIDRPDAGGGVILDITVHDADTLRFVLDDEPVAVDRDDFARRHGPRRARGRRHGRHAVLQRRCWRNSTTLSPPNMRRPASKSTARRAR